MAYSKAFLEWAKEQAAAHGGNAKISNASKLASKYSIGKFKTWNEIIIAAGGDPNDVKPVAAKKPSSDKLSYALNEAKIEAQGQLERIDNTVPGSAEFNTAKTKYKEAKDRLAKLQADFDATVTKEKELSDRKKQEKDLASQAEQAKADIAIEKLNKEKALAKDPNADVSAIDGKISAAQAKIAQAKAGVKPAATVGPNYTKAPPALSGGAAKVVPVKTPSKTPSKDLNKTPGKTVTPAITADQAHAAAVVALQGMDKTAGGYAIQMGLIDSDPSLKELFYNDVYLPISQGKDPVDAKKFQADFLNTKWYKSYMEPAREAEAIKWGDPATWKESVASAEKLVRDNALSMGYDISPEQVTQAADMFLHKAGGKAESLVGGLVFAEMKTYVASIGKLNASGGLAASGIANLKSTAGDYGVAHLFSDDWYKTQQDAILKGTTTQAAVDLAIKTAAKSSYGALSSQIDAGMSVKSILSPYANLMGNILEVAPGSADISDPKFASNVFIQDPADPSKQILKPLWQYQQDLKKDPRWAYTQNARADLDQVGHSVLTSLGLTY